MIAVDDLIASLIDYLNTAVTFKTKDPTGAADYATGTLLQLFPGLVPGADGKLHVIPTNMYDVEEVPLPFVAVSVSPSAATLGELFGSTIHQFNGRLIVCSTVVDAKGEKDYDASVLLGLRLQTALLNHFTKDDDGDVVERMIPWYIHRYDSGGTRTLSGAFTLRSFQITPVDDNRFVGAFSLEVIG